MNHKTKIILKRLEENPSMDLVVSTGNGITPVYIGRDQGQGNYRGPRK